MEEKINIEISETNGGKGKNIIKKKKRKYKLNFSSKKKKRLIPKCIDVLNIKL